MGLPTHKQLASGNDYHIKHLLLLARLVEVHPMLALTEREEDLGTEPLLKAACALNSFVIPKL